MRRRPSPEEMVEIGDLGWEIYQKEIEQHLTDADHGAFIAIDVDNGEWAVGSEAIRAMDAKNEDARILTMVHIVGPTIGFGGATFSSECAGTAGASAR